MASFLSRWVPHSSRRLRGWVRGGPAGDLEGLNQLPTHGQRSGGCVGAGDEGGMAKLQNTMLQGSREVKGAPPPLSSHCSWMNTSGGKTLCSSRADVRPFPYNLTVRCSDPIELNAQTLEGIALGNPRFSR